MLVANSISCLRGERWLFENLNFQIDFGDIIHIQGQNGSGKTTLLRLLAGFLLPTLGQFLFNSKPMNTTQFQKKCVYLGHKNGIKMALTPKENLLHSSNCFFESDHHKISVNNILDRLGLLKYADYPCQQLSAGQCRKVALGNLFLSNRQIWLLDEPMNTLDQNTQNTIANLIADHTNKGGCAVFASHTPLFPKSVPMKTISLEL